MNIVFMRHGEATDNVRKLISDKEIYWSILTDKGIQDVKESIALMPQTIDKIYVSPFPRTIQTAHLVRTKLSNVEYVIDNRIREINYGKYSGQKNNEELDKTREKQIAGDYFVRFGDFGENKLEIELRLISFLKDVIEYNSKNNTIMIISHGSIMSFMKRILNLKSMHLKTGKVEVFNDVDIYNINEYYEKLLNIKKTKS